MSLPANFMPPKRSEDIEFKKRREDHFEKIYEENRLAKRQREKEQSLLNKVEEEERKKDPLFKSIDLKKVKMDLLRGHEYPVVDQTWSKASILKLLFETRQDLKLTRYYEETQRVRVEAAELEEFPKTEEEARKLCQDDIPLYEAVMERMAELARIHRKDFFNKTECPPLEFNAKF